MASTVSRLRLELIQTLQELLESLQQETEIYNMNCLATLVSSLQQVVREFKAKDSRRELQWCRKLQAIATEALEPALDKPVRDTSSTPEEETPSPDESSNASHSTDSDPHTINGRPLSDAESTQEDCSIEEATVHGASEANTAAEDPELSATSSSSSPSPTSSSPSPTSLSALTTPSRSSPPKTASPPTTSSSPTASPATAPSSLRSQPPNCNQALQLSPCLSEDELKSDLEKMSEKFQLWTGDPKLFWDQSSCAVQLEGPTFLDRLSTLCNYAVHQRSKAEGQNWIHRFDSVLIYLIFQQMNPEAKTITEPRLYDFLNILGLPVGVKSRLRELLVSGRQRVRFCWLLRNDSVTGGNPRGDDDFDLPFDISDFGDLNYGVFFLDLHDKIWSSSRTRCRVAMEATATMLKAFNIDAVSEASGAKLAAKTLLRFRRDSLQLVAATLHLLRQASLQPTNRKRPASFDEGVIDSTTASKRPRSEAAKYTDYDLDTLANAAIHVSEAKRTPGTDSNAITGGSIDVASGLSLDARDLVLADGSSWIDMLPVAAYMQDVDDWLWSELSNANVSDAADAAISSERVEDISR